MRHKIKFSKSVWFRLMIFSFMLLSNIVSANHYFEIHKNNESFIVSEQYSNKVIFTSKIASEAIQYAIDFPEDGEIHILLGSGIFQIENALKLRNNTILSGRMKGTELRLTKYNPIAIELESVTNVLIENLTISTGSNGNSNSAVFISNSTMCKLMDVIVTGFANYGFSIKNHNMDLLIERCTFIENWESHIFINEVTGSKEAPIVIRGNTFIRGGYGTRVIGSKEQSSRGLHFKDNMCFYTRSAIFDSDYTSVQFSGNRSYWCESDVIVMRGSDFSITGNSMSWNRGHSLVLDGATNGSVIGNNFTDQGARSRDGHLKCGIFMYNTKNVTIASCSIWNFGDQGHMEYAIYEDKTCSDNIITANAAWFHAHNNAFSSNGRNTKILNNNSNTGIYRGDWWDFTQKYGFTTDKFMKEYLMSDDIPVAESEDILPVISGSHNIGNKGAARTGFNEQR